METPSTILPAHIEETIRAIAKLQAQHEREATPFERFVERLTAAIGRPGFLLLLLVAVAAWVLANIAAGRLGRLVIDPPPFNWLQDMLSLMALCVTVIILTTQRRADKLASHREQLTLELAILGEQKTAKVIQLLEELRRDNPLLVNRVDHEANAMARPADPEAVLNALVSTEPAEETEGEAEPHAA